MRLERVAQSIDNLRAVLEDETEARDQLILEAVDRGHSRAEVARWSRVGRTRITQIVASRALELQEAAASS